MSERGMPRSYRMMQGVGVHPFRLINAQGQSVFCKFHWKPLQGTHSLPWDEAVKISGEGPRKAGKICRAPCPSHVILQQIAVLVEDGVHHATLVTLHGALTIAGASCISWGHG